MSFDDTTYKIPDHYPRTFQLNFDHAIQQTESRFKDMGMVDSGWTGKEHVFRDLSATAWTRDDSRFGKTNARESEASFRKGFKKKLQAQPIHFDEWDEALLDRVVLPKSEEQQAMMYGYERALDDLFIAACGETVYGGADPYTTPISFPNSQIIAVNYAKPGTAPGSDLGLTTWKLLAAKKRFEELDINLDREEVCLAISPEEELQLMLQVEASPNDIWANAIAKWFEQYNSGNTGAKLLGMFKVIKSNRLAVASSVRTCYAFCKSAFVKSPTTAVRTSIDRIPSERNKLLIQGSAMVGIVRRKDEKILALPCKQI